HERSQVSHEPLPKVRGLAYPHTYERCQHGLSRIALCPKQSGLDTSAGKAECLTKTVNAAQYQKNIGHELRNAYLPEKCLCLSLSQIHLLAPKSNTPTARQILRLYGKRFETVQLSHEEFDHVLSKQIQTAVLPILAYRHISWVYTESYLLLV